MENPILTKKEETAAQATQLIGGLDTHEVELNVKQNTKVVLITALANAMNAKAAYDAAVTAQTALSTALSVANENVKAFLDAARGVLVYFIGAMWSQAWMATGFPDQSTQVPRTSSAREMLLMSLKAYFTANPTQEVLAFNVTATTVESLRAALETARRAYTEGLADCRAKRIARDAAFDVLRRRMRGLISELETVLDPNDSRWLAFGLNIPGSPATPEVPTDVLVTLTGTTAAMKWNAGARADYYRIWQKVHGADEDYRAIGSASDLDFTVEALPSNQTVDLAVSAVNDGGESALSAAVTVVTH